MNQSNGAITRKPKAIIFDWDNTLVDTWEVIHAALVETFTTLGHVPWTLDETKSRVAHSLRDSFPKLFGERWTEARRVYLDSYAAIHLERLAALPGMARQGRSVAEPCAWQRRPASGRRR